MGAGDVQVIVVNTPTDAEIDTALTTVRTTGGANGTYGMVALDGRVFVWGITEA